MDLQLVRDPKAEYDDRTLGSIYVNTVWECHSLEDKDRRLEAGGVKIPGQTAIGRGRYRIALNWSDRHRCLMFQLLDVPQFTGVRFDIANTPGEIQGCIAVGRYVTHDPLAPQGSSRPILGESATALKFLSEKILAAMLKGEEVWIEIS